MKFEIQGVWSMSNLSLKFNYTSTSQVFQQYCLKCGTNLCSIDCKHPIDKERDVLSFCAIAFANHTYASIVLNSIDYILEEMYYTMYKALSNNLVSSTDLYITGSILWWTTGEQISNTKLLTFYYLLLILKQKSQVTISESRHLVIFICSTNYFSCTRIAYLHTSSKCTFQ